MSDYIPINLPAIEARSAQRMAKFMLAEQVSTAERFTEQVEQAFNPAASEVIQSRLNRFRPLDQRRRVLESKETLIIEEVDPKTEQDLAQEFNKRNPELPADRLSNLRKSITDTMREEEILDRVNEAFKDPTLADEALEFLSRTTTGALQTRIRRAREIFVAEKRREIVAGRNITPAARAFNEKGLGESPTELRELYRDMTGEIRDHHTMFNELSEKYPFEDLKLVVAFLLQGLVYDLKSKGPSIQSAELIRLMSDVRNLQSILWVFLFFKSRMKLIKSMISKYGLVPSRSMSFDKLAKMFMKLVEERYPTILKLIKQLEDEGYEDSVKLIVLTQYRDAIRGLSPRVYKSPRHQQDLLLVILEALEDLEDKLEPEE